MTFEEYAALDPAEEPETIFDEPKKEKSFQQIREEQGEAMRIKDSIPPLLESGAAPEIVLAAAVKCISLLTGDAEFLKQANDYMGLIWGDPSQAAIDQMQIRTAAEKLEAVQADNERKLRKYVNNLIKREFDTRLALQSLIEELDLAKSNREAADEENPFLEENV